MKRFAVLAAALLSATAAHARPQAHLSLGPILSVPEIVGGQLSYWAGPDVTIDARITLSSLDAGVTGHIPIAGNDSVRHSIVLTGMGGYIHRGVQAGTYSDTTHGTGGRILGAAGYGYSGSVDMRIEGGLSAYDVGDAGWQLDPTFFAYLGFFL